MSKTTFLVGIVVAILASSLISTVISTQYVRGPKGDKGDSGPVGPQGLSGISRIPFASYAPLSGFSSTNSTESVDMLAYDSTSFTMSVQISVENKSNLAIVFNAYLRLEWSQTGIGWTYATITALVDGNQTSPYETRAIETSSSVFGAYSSSAHGYSGFFWKEVVAGTHNVKIQWKVSDSNTKAYAMNQYLVVYALPSS